MGMGMRLSRILAILPALALSACAVIDKPKPAPVPDIALKQDTSIASERPAPGAKTKAGRRSETLPPEAAADSSVYFASDDAKLDERGEQVLRRHAARLKSNPQQIVTLVGYADPLGSPSYNLALTEERLDTVSETLRSLGVARGQIRRFSGGQATDSGCDSAACRQRLRRVELIYEK